MQLHPHAQKTDFLHRLDSIMKLDQYYDKCTDLGTMDVLEQDSLMHLDRNVLLKVIGKLSDGLLKLIISILVPLMFRW